MKRIAVLLALLALPWKVGAQNRECPKCNGMCLPGIIQTDNPAHADCLDTFLGTCRVTDRSFTYEIYVCGGEYARWVLSDNHYKIIHSLYLASREKIDTCPPTMIAEPYHKIPNPEWYDLIKDSTSGAPAVKYDTTIYIREIVPLDSVPIITRTLKRIWPALGLSYWQEVKDTTWRITKERITEIKKARQNESDGP